VWTHDPQCESSLHADGCRRHSRRRVPINPKQNRDGRICVDSTFGKGSTFQMGASHARRHYVTKPYSPDQLLRII
jgi:hypothetical protein